ncbi:MAG: ATP-binding protein, partial [bacterium]|nr:ATP-binding protein [bacterium]
MAISNCDRVEQAVEAVRTGLIPYVEQELAAHLGPAWFDELTTGRDTEASAPVLSGVAIYDALAKQQTAVAVAPTAPTSSATSSAEALLPDLKRDDSGTTQWPVASLLQTMVEAWDRVFQHTLGDFELALARELRGAQERAAAQQTFTSDDTYRILDSAERLLKAVSATEQAAEVAALRNNLQRTVFAERARQQTRRTLAVEGKPEAGLNPWRQVVTPHPDVASGRYMQAEFAADLAQVHKGEGSDEYRDPIELYRRTFITAGLHDLLVGALERLTGHGSDPVVELQTNFGGGKTHALLALYHLFGGTPSNRLPGLESVLADARVDAAPTARRAVLVGTALSPGQASIKADGTRVHTLWGEMAWQLDGAEGYQLLQDSDEKGTSPGSNLLVELFQRCGPCLVLLDEWVAYARQLVHKRDLPSGSFEAQASFAQALTEAAKAVDTTLVVASIPSSKIEIGGSHGEFALDALKNVFSRVAKP